ncbi:MAG: nuclear transport factor 2 family protein [Porticoccaceae bacterium]|nr:nuclear transport factor 2 family protein [Pseudomonadales bacterium]MCP5171089.1 nuclear transport factor 2 family protein [Pseudomonadales bacterium]MCP5301672.1 nuclear transport factor 2 family protein [Pseudomonadales bacterium]
MEALQSLEIINLSSRFFSLIDHGRAAEVADFFTLDGMLTFGEPSPNAGEHRGREAIGIFFAARQANAVVATRHVVSNFLISATGPDTAKAGFLMTVFRGRQSEITPEAMFVADVTDTYERFPQGWLIATRLIQPVFVTAY